MITSRAYAYDIYYRYSCHEFNLINILLYIYHHGGLYTYAFMTKRNILINYVGLTNGPTVKLILTLGGPETIPLPHFCISIGVDLAPTCVMIPLSTPAISRH